jgi:hypothetical protein
MINQAFIFYWINKHFNTNDYSSIELLRLIEMSKKCIEKEFNTKEIQNEYKNFIYNQKKNKV